MKKFVAPNGYKYIIDEEAVCTEVASPDDFDESRLRLATEAEALAFEQEQKDNIEPSINDVSLPQ